MLNIINKVIEINLKFLVDKFNFKFNYFWETPNAKYVFENQYGKFIYLELPQFQEKFFYVEDGQGKREINLYENYSQEYEEWQKNHSGIKWIFKNKDKDIWEFNSKIIRDTINKTGTLFGLKI